VQLQRIDIVPDAAAGTLRVMDHLKELRKQLRDLFDADGLLRNGTAEEAIERLSHAAHPKRREPLMLAIERLLTARGPAA
jgi:hypothetical protein